ncbi:cobalamin-dependent protein [Anoxynatronum buryatiense]|uniref:Methanogenic corrinoid protein MtbC1 n=1 Tax=Anoxynatronum buryatiense TaxID=489973 RepID=A0AA46AHV7_9CLOT|nr:cobalamin-dependent protein [Anoxynatronum buryatiense]SMP44101.1 Methanogenic corrinoid protein MtbC1 [Anoxynatronum buryatiense]
MAQNFGDRLRGLRKGQKKSQQELASLLGLSQTTIANYENNSRFPNDTILLQLADHFQVSLDYLLGRTEDASPFLSGAVTHPPQQPDEAWSSRYLEALIRTDIREAWRVLSLASKMGISLEIIHDQIIKPALYEAGVQWQKGKLDIAQEHFITAETERFISLLRKKPSSVSTGPLIVALAAGDERHTLGLRMVSSALEETGYTVMYLGSQLPFSSLQFVLNQYPVKVVAISASLLSHVNEARFFIHSLRELESYDHIKVLVGGQAFTNAPHLWKSIGADGYASDAVSAIEEVKRLLEQRKPR